MLNSLAGKVCPPAGMNDLEDDGVMEGWEWELYHQLSVFLSAYMSEVLHRLPPLLYQP
jgi:hypothetical protein